MPREVNVSLTRARKQDRARLEALLQLYAHDFSEVLGMDVGDDGRFDTPRIDEYFGDPRSHAFLIRVGGRLAGFALVRRCSRLSGDKNVCDVEEFFVLRKYRRHGVGERAARWLFDRFRGRWEVREKAENRGAIAFWRRVIRRYTRRKLDEIVLDDQRWRGPVQRFDSRRC
jgi:predicted acetyltransferase